MPLIVDEDVVRRAFEDWHKTGRFRPGWPGYDETGRPAYIPTNLSTSILNQLPERFKIDYRARVLYELPGNLPDLQDIWFEGPRGMRTWFPYLVVTP